jgi:hypothetical protein
MKIITAVFTAALLSFGVGCAADIDPSDAESGGSDESVESLTARKGTLADGTKVDIVSFSDAVEAGSDQNKGSREKGETDCTRAAKTGAGRTDLEARCAYARQHCTKTEQKILGCANVQKRAVIKSKKKPEQGSNIIIDGATWVIVTVTVIVGVGFELLLNPVGG